MKKLRKQWFSEKRVIFVINRNFFNKIGILFVIIRPKIRYLFFYINLIYFHNTCILIFHYNIYHSAISLCNTIDWSLWGSCLAWRNGINFRNSNLEIFRRKNFSKGHNFDDILECPFAKRAVFVNLCTFPNYFTLWALICTKKNLNPQFTLRNFSH